jgi:hypothetical protein
MEGSWIMGYIENTAIIINATCPPGVSNNDQANNCAPAVTKY